MHFDFSDDQQAFREAARDFLQGAFGVDQLRSAWEETSGRLPGMWERLQQQGLCNLLGSEDHGGLGLGMLDAVGIFEEAGRVALAEPLIEHAAVSVPLLTNLAATSDAAAALLTEACEGNLVITLLYPEQAVPYAAQAHRLLIVDGERLLSVAPDEATLLPQESFDRTRKLARLQSVPDTAELVATGPQVTRALAEARHHGALAASAFAVGAADTMVGMAVEHTSQRTQFGKAIGSFQAVQHRLVNAWMAAEFARPALYRAAASVHGRDPEAALHVAMARVYAIEAGERAAKEALQCHGAIAYTTEYPLHMWMKRVWALSRAYGTQREYERLIEERILGPAPSQDAGKSAFFGSTTHE